MTKAISAVGVVVCMIWLLSADAVFAGEVNGKGDSIPGGANGRSDCSYSGQQDDPVADDGFFRGDRVQNWGQIPKENEDSELGIGRALLTMLGQHPGQACNPNTGEGEL